MALSKSFTAAGNSLYSLLHPGARAAYSITGTYTGTIVLEQAVKGATTFGSIRNTSGSVVTATDAAAAGIVQNDGPRTVILRFRSTGAMTGTAVAALQDVAGSIVEAGVGLPTAGVAALEEGDAKIHKTTLIFANFPLTLRNTEQGQGGKVYDFPAGRIAILGAVGKIAMITTSVVADTLNGAKTCNWGVGSITQANGTLATQEQDIIPTTAITSSATVNVSGAVSPAQLAAALQLDGTSAAIDAFLNVGIATADDIDADATVVINGYVTITWINLGDV